MKLELRLALRCGVCDQLLNSERQENDLATALLMGTTDPYQICPCCKQIPPEDTKQNQEYRRKTRVWLFVHYHRVVRVP